MAGPLEHPPQTSAIVRPLAVIHHGLHVVGKPERGGPLRKALAAGQRMAPARCGPVGLGRGAAGAGRAWLGAQIMVQVGIHGARDMRLRILLRARRGLCQIEAAIEHHQRRAAGGQGLQFTGADQRSANGHGRRGKARGGGGECGGGGGGGGGGVGGGGGGGWGGGGGGGGGGAPFVSNGAGRWRAC